MTEVPADLASLIAQVIGTVRRATYERADLATALHDHPLRGRSAPAEPRTPPAAPVDDLQPVVAYPDPPGASEKAGRPPPRPVSRSRERSSHDYNYFTELNEEVARLRSRNGTE